MNYTEQFNALMVEKIKKTMSAFYYYVVCLVLEDNLTYLITVINIITNTLISDESGS